MFFKKISLLEAVITPNQYEIKLPQFEGPFDLLLFFIERDELDIHNIPISKITNDFFDYVKAADTMNIELASEFSLNTHAHQSEDVASTFS